MDKKAIKVISKYLDAEKKKGHQKMHVIANLGFTYHRLYNLMSKGAVPTNDEQKRLHAKLGLSRDDMLGKL